jgi:RNA polymerase sigma factor (sigma-70 family)
MTRAELRQLARQAQAGDPAAGRELWVELYGAVRRHVHVMLGPSAITDDAVQDTMIALYRGLARFRGDVASPRTWALAIATRIAWRLRRKETRYLPVDDGTMDARVLVPALPANTELATLRSALAALTDDKRDVVILMAIFELSAEEAGRVLGTLPNTAASRYRRARAELEARLRPVDQPRS